MTTKNTRIREGGANVFADLGLPDTDNHFLKAQIVAELYRLTSERKLTQQKAGDSVTVHSIHRSLRNDAC